jgi:phosphatidylserine/phosphatidylglycerophosphate/cardiolipin synthase-like enzyme
MIVDGTRLLLGSHTWSQPGVTLNRDASLLFDDQEIAAYYARAFEVDWKRSRKLTPSRHIPEAIFLESPGAPVPAGYRRVPLDEWLTDG